MDSVTEALEIETSEKIQETEVTDVKVEVAVSVEEKPVETKDEVIEAKSKSEECSSEESVNNENESVPSRSSSRGSQANEFIGQMPQYQYDKRDLFKLSKVPCSKEWPPFLDKSYKNPGGLWDPEKWFRSKRRSESPLVDDIRAKRDRPVEYEREATGGNFKRKTPDPKERIKEERDDIVLSPQRRSFGTGCHVSQQATSFPNWRPGSPSDSRENENPHRDNRRIGSGRIVTRDRDRDQRDWEKDHRDFGYRNRFDRDDRDKDSGGGRMVNRYRNDRNDRRMSRESEPEWFSSGPTSQHDTIELVGFDDPSSDDRRPMRGRKTKELVRKQSYPLSDRNSKEKHLDTILESKSSSVTKPNVREESKNPPSSIAKSVAVESLAKTRTPTPPIETGDNSPTKKKDFDINDIFKTDWMQELLPNGTPIEPTDPGVGGLGGSRFSQWFSRDSPELEGMTAEESRSSIQEEIRAKVYSMGGGSRPQSSSPPHHGPHNKNNTFPHHSAMGQLHDYLGSQLHHQNVSSPEKGKNILEILQSANINVTPLLHNETSHTVNLKRHALSGKVKSVVELEADLKQLVLSNQNHQQQQPSQGNGNKSAFNKLLTHLTDAHNSSAGEPPMSMGPLDKSKALQEVDLIENLFLNQPVMKMAPSNQQPMPDLRVSPVHSMSSVNRGGMGPSLMDMLKEAEAPTMNHHQQGQIHHNMDLMLGDQGTVADFLRSCAMLNHSPQADMLGQMVSQSGLQQPLQPLPPNIPQSQQQQNMFIQPGDKRNMANFQNKQKQNGLDMQANAQRPKFMASLIPGPFTHLLPPSPTQEGQSLSIPMAITGHLSPRQSPLSHDVAATVHNQGRIPSPLVFGQQPPVLSHAPAPIHPSQLSIGQGNTLQVQNANARPRVPSPQELAAHTQTILQNALIKRKLEEQKENYRKRQEAQRSPNPGQNLKTSPTVTSSNASPSKQIFTASMAAFTPTSVMRKMHSEKLDKENRGQSPLGITPVSPEHKLHGDMMQQQHNGNHGSNLELGSHLLYANMGDHMSQRTGPNLIGPNSPGGAPRALHGQGNYHHLQYVGQNPQLAQQQQSQQSQFQQMHQQAPFPMSQQSMNPMAQQSLNPMPQQSLNPMAQQSLNQMNQHHKSHPPPIHISQQQMNQSSRTQSMSSSLGQGRPIVKGGGASEHLKGVVGIGMNAPKPFSLPNQSTNLIRPDMDPVARLVEQQRILSQQQQLSAQRQLNASPMTPVSSVNPASFSIAPRCPPPSVLPQNMMRPSMNNSNVNLPLLRSMVHSQQQGYYPVPSNRGHAQMNPMSQFNHQYAALQQQQQHQVQQQRKAAPSMDPRRNLHPIALQQLLNNNMGITGRQDGSYLTNSGLKNQQLLPPGQMTGGNRHSPVNLARWFGNDVLKQKMPDMPPVPLQNALSVEELERQQHPTVVRN